MAIAGLPIKESNRKTERTQIYSPIPPPNPPKKTRPPGCVYKKPI